MAVRFSVQDTGIGAFRRKRQRGIFKSARAGRHVDYPQVWRNRPGTGDHPAPGLPHGRRRHAGKHAPDRQHVLVPPRLRRDAASRPTSSTSSPMTTKRASPELRIARAAGRRCRGQPGGGTTKRCTGSVCRSIRRVTARRRSHRAHHRLRHQP